MRGGWIRHACLKESLDLDIDELDLDLPTHVEIEADVTDFELDSIYTMVTAELFEDLDASDLKNRDTDEGADALRDAMSQLIDGSSSLTDALNQIAQGGGALSTGADALREALGMLPGGLTELKAGAQTLSDRLDEASGVAESLAQASSGGCRGDDAGIPRAWRGVRIHRSGAAVRFRLA